MIIAKVIGNVTSTVKDEFYNGVKVLVVQPITKAGLVKGKSFLAAETNSSIGAGIGDSVLVIVEGNGARQVSENQAAPVHSVVLGIIDEVENESS